MLNQTRLIFALAIVVSPVAWPAPQVENSSADDNLAALRIEELTKVSVTSVARKDQQLMNVAAAAFVITQDDIRRSGATSVPDVLRMVPGIEVAQINSSVWAISARGFNSRFANKILVLIDGRSIYNAIFSGTFWDQNQVPLDDIERIEVIRGPGATMWGANAVDGVINILTKKAKDTQGWTVSTGISQDQLPTTGVRYGGQEGDDIQYRVETNFQENLPLVDSARSSAGDRWDAGQGNARVDWRISDRDSLTVDGQIYRGGGNNQVDLAFPNYSGIATGQPFEFSGGFMRGRWQRQLAASDLELQISYTNEARAEWISRGTLQTADIDFQHHIHLGGRNDFNWGAEGRLRHDSVIGSIQPGESLEGLVGLFAQDEMTLVPSHLSVTGGIKVEDFLYSSNNHVAVQPQVRLLWTPNKSNTIWGAVTRAARMPSLLERDTWFPYPLPAQDGIPVEGLAEGNPALPSEVLIAYEGGYRRQLGKRLNLDVAAFFNHYSRLIENVMGTPYIQSSPDPEIIVPVYYATTSGAASRGLEVAASWAARRRWRLQLGWSWQSANLANLSPFSPVATIGGIWATPSHVASLRSSWDFRHRWSFDSTIYGVTSVPGAGVPGYIRVDLRFARRLGEASEISAGIQNLTDSHHWEFLSEDYLFSSYMRRNAFMKIVWKF